MTRTHLNKHWPMWTFVVVVALSSLWSAIEPVDRATWFFELLFGWIGFVILVVTYPRFRFSSLAYLSCAFFFFVLAWGAKHTYAEVPWFNWLEETFNLSRNHADRFGHFFQGFVPAILVRELLLRTSKIGRGGWLTSISILVPLACSAFYELLEMWWVAAFYPTEGPDWLGHQNDPWDAQWDMTMALAGAMLAVFALAWLHRRSIRKVTGA